MSRIRRVALGLWMSLVLALMVAYAINPALLRPEGLVDALRQSGQPVLVAFVALSVVRPFTLIPSTALIIVGTLLFPNQPWFVMISSLVGIVVSAALVYFFFDFLGIGDLLSVGTPAGSGGLRTRRAKRGFGLLRPGQRFHSYRPMLSVMWPVHCA